MRFLTKIKYGIRNIKIKQLSLNNFAKNKTKHYQRFTYGQTFLHKNLINIDKNCSSSMKLETLFHELGHCIIDETSMNSFLEESNEEIVVQNFAVGFLTILKDNPRLLNLIKQYERETDD